MQWLDQGNDETLFWLTIGEWNIFSETGEFRSPKACNKQPTS